MRRQGRSQLWNAGLSLTSIPTKDIYTWPDVLFPFSPLFSCLFLPNPPWLLSFLLVVLTQTSYNVSHIPTTPLKSPKFCFLWYPITKPLPVWTGTPSVCKVLWKDCPWLLVDFPLGTMVSPFSLDSPKELVRVPPLHYSVPWFGIVLLIFTGPTCICWLVFSHLTVILSYWFPWDKDHSLKPSDVVFLSISTLPDQWLRTLSVFIHFNVCRLFLLLMCMNKAWMYELLSMVIWLVQSISLQTHLD